MTDDKWTSGEEVTPTDTQAAKRPEEAANQWERDVLNRLAFASLNEQRRARRWGIFFKSLIFIYLFGILALVRFGDGGEIVHGPHTALVDLQGVIAPQSNASADIIVTGLRAAFEASKSKAVILRINSPGGSPVQAGYINDEIKRLRGLYPDKPLYAVVSDVCASGGYFVAVAADKIFVDPASIVGSIGVRMDSFGFVDAMDKLGVERRLLTAGEHKGFLDPFLPAKEEDVAHVQSLLDDIHQQFIDRVRAGRGDRLKEIPNLYSGLIWTGEQSVEIGLADEFGNSSHVARDIVGAEDIIDYTPRPDFLERFADQVGVAMGKAVSTLLGEGVQLR